MLSRSEIIDRLKSFKDIDTYNDIEAFNTEVGLYVVKAYKWHKTMLIIDRAQDNKVIYLDNRVLCADMRTFLKVLAEAYNLDRDFKEPKEYIGGVIDLLRGQQEALGYMIGGERDSRAAYLASRTIRVFFNNNGKLTLIKLADRDIFLNPNSFLESAKITLYLKGSLAFSTNLGNLTKQEVSR